MTYDTCNTHALVNLYISHCSQICHEHPHYPPPTNNLTNTSSTPLAPVLLAWPAPAPITYGELLSLNQLNATVEPFTQVTDTGLTN